MYYLGVDVGGTNIAVGVVDENNAIVAKASQKTPVPCSEEVFCDKIVEVCHEALGKANLTLDDVPWIGVGSPGTINKATGIIEFANNLPSRTPPWWRCSPAAWTARSLMENDANAAAFGEYMAGALKAPTTRWPSPWHWCRRRRHHQTGDGRRLRPGRGHRRRRGHRHV